MAFQAGTQVDPRLLDYSGYARGITNAAAINAQALTSLGQVVGEGIDKYNEKQIEKKQKKEATPVIASFLRQIDPSLSEEQSKAGATNFINSVGIEGVQAAIPIFALEGMKSQNKIRLAQLEAFGELGKKDELSVTDQQKALEGFAEDGIYYKQGFRIKDGQLFREVDPTPGRLGPGFKSDVQLVPVTEGPVYNVAEQSGVLAQTPTIDTSMIVGGAQKGGSTQVGPGAGGSFVMKPADELTFDSLNIGVEEEAGPTLEQFEDITQTIDYGDFDVPKPKVIEQEGFRSLTATNRPETFEEYKAKLQDRKRRNRRFNMPEGKELEESYQRYLDQFKYKYPKTYEDYSGGREDLVEAYESVYLPRFY